MTRIVAACFLFFLFSCKKENNRWITATVSQIPGCYPNSWMVTIDNPNASRHPFLCDRTVSTASSSTTNCGNSVMIINLPAPLHQPGTQIKFSKWEDKGLLCFSSTLAPHHLEVSDVSAK
jgi:hypothetical protein